MKTGTTRNTDEGEGGGRVRRVRGEAHPAGRAPFERDRDERRQRDELPRHRQAVLDHRVDREAAPVQGQAEKSNVAACLT